MGAWFHIYGGLIMFGLLVLEVADRVTMKRDLQIAREIQSWLVPVTHRRLRVSPPPSSPSPQIPWPATTTTSFIATFPT